MVWKSFETVKIELCKDVFEAFSPYKSDTIEFSVEDEHSDDEFTYESKSCKANVLFCLASDTIPNEVFKLKYYLAEAKDKCVFVILVDKEGAQNVTIQKNDNSVTTATIQSIPEEEEDEFDSDFEEEDAVIRYMVCPVSLGQGSADNSQEHSDKSKSD